MSAVTQADTHEHDAEIDALKQQRDELLEVLKKMSGAMDAMGDYPDVYVAPHVWRELNCQNLIDVTNAIIANIESNIAT